MNEKHRNGPAIGEAVLVQSLDVEIGDLTGVRTPLRDVAAPGEVVAIDWRRETFTIQLAHGVRPLSLSVDVPLSEYGRNVIGRWTCGHGNQSMRCYLSGDHVGPHLYKPTNE